MSEIQVNPRNSHPSINFLFGKDRSILAIVTNQYVSFLISSIYFHDGCKRMDSPHTDVDCCQIDSDDCSHCHHHHQRLSNRSICPSLHPATPPYHWHDLWTLSSPHLGLDPRIGHTMFCSGKFFWCFLKLQTYVWTNERREEKKFLLGKEISQVSLVNRKLGGNGFNLLIAVTRINNGTTLISTLNHPVIYFHLYIMWSTVI